RGFLKYYAFLAKYHLGNFKLYSAIDWGRVERLVFVCHGNMCRSPLGEGVSRAGGVDAVSCGLYCRDGAGANPRAISYAESVGLSLEQHKTQNIKHYFSRRTDLMVAMEPEHLNLLAIHRGGAQVTLAGLWAKSPSPYIHDPYNASDM